MTWKTHKATAFSIFIATGLFRYDLGIINLPLILFGAIFPDLIEHSFSFRSQDLFYKIHRTFGHYWWLYCIPIIVYVFFLQNIVTLIIYYISIGALIHILGDLLTPGGVPALWHNYYIKLPIVKTGTIKEFIFAVALLVISVILFKFRYLQDIGIVHYIIMLFKFSFSNLKIIL